MSRVTWHSPVPGDDPSQSVDRTDVSVVIPCFNEVSRIGATVRTVTDYLNALGWSWEMLVVDDGSGDLTATEARAAAEGDQRVRVVRFDSNHGKGWACREGFRQSRGEAVLLCDADLSTPIDELAGFMEGIVQGDDVVIASRVADGAQIVVRQPATRRIAGRAFRVLVHVLRLTSCRDTQCGFKLLRRASVAAAIESTRTTGYAFDVELLMQCEARRLAIREQPVAWRDSAGSKFRLAADGPRAVADVLRLRLPSRPFAEDDRLRQGGQLPRQQ
jgi:dolichyl-phosphate beta-glucosyltransferase